MEEAIRSIKVIRACRRDIIKWMGEKGKKSL